MSDSYLFMVKEWDPYAGEAGEWIWKVHTEIILSDNEAEQARAIDIIVGGLKAAGKVYSYGKVGGDTA